MRISRKIPREMMPRDGSAGPTRRIETRHPLRVIRLYPSVLIGCLVPCESAGEMLHWMTLDADASVIAARAQPDQIRWNDCGTERRHVPDAEVRFDDGSVVLREVKAYGDLSPRSKAEVDWRTAVLQSDLPVRGIGYELVDSTCTSFRRSVVAAKDILAVRHRSVPPGLPVLVREAVLLHGAVTVGDLQAMLPMASRADLLTLALHRHLVIDLGAGPISQQTSIRLPHANAKELFR
ncbi:hypothetical protein [Muricoccus vinaceus]|uniref:TnsA endonuclease N-terminal domain-containing protein n=1 Tax=Muricoccus vinaceus TaxID=424704 RepID=A0ABV6IT74_9PROT